MFMKCKLSKYIQLSEPLDDKNDLRSERIIYSTRTGKGIKVTNYVVALLENEEYDDIPDRLYTILMYHEIIIPADENELDLVIQRKYLTSVDEQLRRHNIWVHDREETAFFIESWFPKAEARRELIVSIEVADAQRGIRHLTIMLDRLSSPDVGAHAIDVDLIITTLQVGALVEHLPLNYPPFQRVSFHFKADGRLLPDYLTALIRLLRRVEYLRFMPVAVELRPVNLSSEEFTKVTRQLSELATIPNVQLFIELLTAAGNTNQELLWIIALQQAGVDAKFIPAVDQHFFIIAPTATDPIEYRDESQRRIEETAAKERCFYSAEFSKKIAEGHLICSRCVYLPLCGGSPEKMESDQLCPSFTHNFMKKVEYMYQFALQNH